MGEGDWEQQVLFGKSALPIPKIARMQHGHITAREIRPHLDSEIWDEYFKFAIVRNPFDRFVSVCYFLNRDNDAFSRNALPWMKNALSRPRFRERVLVRPQMEQLSDTDGDLAVDYIGRYESLQASLDEVMSRLGLPPAELEQKNSSEHASYQDCYDAELKAMVGEMYAQDIEGFDYSF